MSENPEKWQKFRGTLAGFGEFINTYATHLKEPINDVNLGKAIRRLPEITNLQADHLDKLLWLWGRINAGTASVEVIDEVKKIERILDSFLSEDEIEELSEATD
ncbi:hypothetical protein CETAM_13460 (plasmid) [Corynebacterium comes]|uniref:Uncharacterized protein n=1 Tax=Corynebacterium comes TaxID=2675218 RepID=A0A6B8W1P4_9CORY|nr:hypothetical protein CETAM_13460 [Corynebacterium comes]